MALFLHFLNREVYRAVNAEFSLTDVSLWLRILTVASTEPLITNFANLLEGGYLVSRGAPLFRELLAHEQLLIGGERPSLAEFLDSRRLRYGFDAARYPMYFIRSATIDLTPTYIRTVSATDYLERQIAALSRRELGLAAAVSHAPDMALINQAMPAIGRVVGERDSSAITRSLFAAKLGSESHEAATARLISALYIKQHMEEFQCDIPSGLLPLIAFEGLGGRDSGRDIALLYVVLSSCGFTAEVLLGPDDSLLAALRGSSRHQQFASRVVQLCRTLRAHLEKKNTGRSARHLAKTVLGTVSEPRNLAIGRSLYEQADQRLSDVTRRLRAADKNFATEFENQIAAHHNGPLVLLVTATKVETQALLKVAEEHTGGSAQYIAKNDYVAVELGYVRGARLIAVQCEPGSVGQSAAQAVITDAIRDFTPQAVILGGIAFGTNPGKQKLGDVLVSKMLVDYERAKIKGGVTIPRGQRIEAAPKLLSVFRAAEATWNRAPVHVGTLLSGEKLIDDKQFLMDLLRREPEAIGGEMEGAGLVAAAKRAKVDWIIAKAIVDWGHEKAATNSEEDQYQAARSAFSLVFWAVSSIGL